MIIRTEIMHLLTAIFTFTIIVVASNELAKVFQKLKLPLITGFIIIGVIAGPALLKMIPSDSLERLKFIDDVALAFIAFAAGNEMFMEELKGKLRRIGIMTASLIVITFLVSFFLLLFISERVPFMAQQPYAYKVGISLLISTIFVARSPASAIAIINELRAKGPFTQTALGVIILKEILVIILFTIIFSISVNLINDIPFDVKKVVLVFVELLVSVGLGYLYCKILKRLFSLKINATVEAFIFLIIGWSLFGLSHFVEHWSAEHFNIRFHIEALLAGIVASFRLTNNTKYRLHLENLIHKIGPFVYVAFFTKVGADIELSVLVSYWQIAVYLFLIRILALIVASVTGSLIIGDKLKNVLMSWTPYITQAGVSLGLITIVASYFPQFGVEFETILIAVVILSLFVGPPLMKRALIAAGEAHQKGQYQYDGTRDVIIFGLENISINLAHTLQQQNWKVKIVTCEENERFFEGSEKDLRSIEVVRMKELNLEFMKKLNMKAADAVVLLMSDYNNYRAAELIYEHFGTPTIVVRVEDFEQMSKFKKFDARVVEPRTAMVSLLENFVRSPYATSLLIGEDEDKEVADIEVLSPEIHGKALREIRLPLGVLVISITRGSESILTHGYTRLRLHDIVTVLGTPEQIEQTRVKLQF